MGDSTVILGRRGVPGRGAPSKAAFPSASSCQRAGMIPHYSSGKYVGCWSPPYMGAGASAGKFARRGDPVPPGKVMVRTLHPLYRSGEFYQIVDPATVPALRREGLRPTIVSGYPGAGAIVGQGEERVYNPWMIVLGAAGGGVVWNTGATLLEALPKKDGILYKLTPWIEVGVGTLDILMAYLFRHGRGVLFGASAAGIALVPRGVALFILRMVEARRGVTPPASAPGSRAGKGARSGQFSPEEAQAIRKAEEELLGKLQQPANAGRARVGATPQVSMANIQPPQFGRESTLWN